MHKIDDLSSFRWILNELQFLGVTECKALYVQGYGYLVKKDVKKECPYIEYSENSLTDFKTYFGVLAESHFQYFEKQPQQSYLILEGEGKFLFTLRRSILGGSDRIIVQEEIHLKHGEVVEYAVPYQAGMLSSGLLSFSLKNVQSGVAYLYSARWAVERSVAVRQVRLGIVACTYKREDAIKGNIEQIYNLTSGRYGADIFVVDNGGTLKEHDFPPGIHLISQDNVGGSGGFGRGMREVVLKSHLTHTLLMDDDILIEPESVRRVFTWLSVFKKGISLAGAMLDLKQPGNVFESGAFYQKGRVFTQGACEAAYLSSRTTQKLIESQVSGYGGWWFFAFETRLINEHGAALPIFVRGDDIEFGIRLDKYGVQHLSVPGIGVWHEPFYSKSTDWFDYYTTRNFILCDYLHTSIVNQIKSLAFNMVNILRLLKINDYHSAEIKLMGIDSFLNDAVFKQDYSPAAHHRALIESLKGCKRSLSSSESFAEFDSALTVTQSHRGRFARAIELVKALKHIIVGPSEDLILYLKDRVDVLRSARKIKVACLWENKIWTFTYDRSRALALLMRTALLPARFFWRTLTRSRKSYLRKCKEMTQVVRN